MAKQVRDEVRNEVQRLDVAGLIGERISQDFQRLEESVANMKANADALNRDIATIHSNIVQEYNTLKGYSWKWLGGVSVAFLVMFSVLGWGMKTILDRNYNATAAVYQKVVTLEDKLAEKPVTGKSRKNWRASFVQRLTDRERISRTVHRFHEWLLRTAKKYPSLTWQRK
nr:hypothetical protein [Providencia stuartii]